MLTEVSTDCPARYFRDTATAATLDRVCIILPARFMLDVEVLVEIGIGAAAIYDSRLSDLAPIVLHLRGPVRYEQQANIPEHVFRGTRSGETLGQLLDAA
eukprot:9488375-Pyramimonas_sp.AAC.1